MEGKIYEAIANIMKELEAVGKTKKADPKMGGYAYRGIDDVYNALQKLMAKYGVFNVPEVTSRVDTERKSHGGNTLYHTTLTVKYRFYAVDGSYVEATVCGEGLDSGDKRSNKALSGAHKYALYQVFTMATEDLVDPDNEAAEKDGSTNEGKIESTEQLSPVRMGTQANTKIEVGKYAGKTFQEAHDLDSKDGFQYASWIDKQKDPHKNLKLFADFVFYHKKR